MSVNQITLVGNIGKDIRSGGNEQNPIANFSVATTYDYKDRAGEKVSETEWHRVSAFGHTARFLLNYASTGRQVYVQGRLRTRKFTDRDGAERSVTEIVADTVQLLGANPNRESREQGERPARQDSAPRAERSAPQAHAAPSAHDNDDDIPF